MKIKTLLNYTAAFVVFMGALSYNLIGFAELRVSYFIITVVLVFWLQSLKGIYFNKSFLFLFSLLVAISFYNIVIGNNTLPLLFKQIFGIFQSAVFFYLLVKINNYDIKELFKIYLDIAFIVALIGIFQEISFWVKFRSGYNYSWIFPLWTLGCGSDLTDRFLRISSILPEPAHFCNVMMPAFFVSVTSFFKDTFKFQKRWKSIVIIVSFFLTFSSVGYIGVFFSLILLLYNYRKVKYIVIIGIVLSISFFLLHNNVIEFRMKFDDSIAALTGKKRLEETNLSTFAIFSNMEAAFKSLNSNPFFGSGLGSHWISYDKYILQDPESPGGIAVRFYHNILCRGDAGSLFLRLLSETGFFGFLIFFVFMFKFYIPKSKDMEGYLWIISNAIVAMFFIKLLRMGHYFVDGFFFFIWVYYFSKLKLREDYKTKAVLNG